MVIVREVEIDVGRDLFYGNVVRCEDVMFYEMSYFCG